MDIHVFYVNMGEMLTFDTSFTTEKVASLQDVIARDRRIPQDRQVLLISGGDSMNPEERVCHYNAGTDTCPIFLFNLMAIEAKDPPVLPDDLDAHQMKHRVEGSNQMAPTLATVSTRTQLALEFKKISSEHVQTCQSLVHHQHLQHQGWSTVVANLDDTLKDFVRHVDKFKTWFYQFMEKKDAFKEMLIGFPESVALLAKMPILECLTELISGSICEQFNMDAPSTLMEFLSAVEQNQNLTAESEIAMRELSLKDEDLLTRLLEEQERVLQDANNTSMKEIRGLEERLYGLEQLIVNAKKIVNDQDTLAQGFVYNEKRCRQLADQNVLPDLCASHKEQLKVMQTNDEHLVNIKKRCAETKRELSANLHIRLRWIMVVEKNVSTVDGKITMHFENVRRLKHRLDKLDQVYRAPTVYSKLCVEVCRRRQFAGEYTRWSGDQFTRAQQWYQNEVQRRKQFFSTIGQHFLKALFPGLDKLPPVVMINQPSGCDELLPAINVEDISTLRQALPELAQYLQLPDISQQSSPRSTVSDISPRSEVIDAGASMHSRQSDISVLTSQLQDSSTEIISSTRDTSSLQTIRTSQLSVETSDHMMLPFGAMDEDVEPVSDDGDHPPSSLTDDFSGGFLTANFFLNEVQSVTPDGRVDNNQELLEMQNSQIERLVLENSTHKKDCEMLANAIRRMKQFISMDLQNLKKANENVKIDTRSMMQCYMTGSVKVTRALENYKTLYEAEVAKQQVTVQTSSEVLKKLETAKLSAEAEAQSLKDELQRMIDARDAINQKRQVELHAAVQQTQADTEKRLTLEHELELERAMEECNEKCLTAQKAAEQSLSETHQAELGSIQENFEHELLKAKNTTASHESEIAGLRKQLEEAHLQSQKHETAMNETNLAHEMEINDIQKRVEEERQLLIAEHKAVLANTISTVHEEKSAALAQLEAKLSDEHDKIVQKLRSEAAADESYMQASIAEMRQVADAERSLAVEQTLREKSQEFQAVLDEQRDQIEREAETKVNLKIEETERKHEERINELMQRLASQAMMESVAPLETPDLKAMEEQLNEKDEMLKELGDKLNAMSMTKSTTQTSQSDKISVKSCSQGDKVILCYDEAHKHYVVFNVSSTFYFLHTDCLADLGLTATSPTDRIKSWVLGEIVEKEYCQAKKPQNRFKVPVGTKFYRVYAKPWSITGASDSTAQKPAADKN